MPTVTMPLAGDGQSISLWSMGADHDDAVDAFRVAVGERIRRERERRGLSQSALAHRMPEHVSASQISRWERARSFPELRSLAELAEALEVPIEAFFSDPPAGGRRRRRS